MACPTCDHTMCCIQAEEGGSDSVYHCGRCGTVRRGDNVYEPDLVYRCRDFESTIDFGEEKDDWIIMGVAEAISRWREKLADVAGYHFFETEHGRKTVAIDWGQVEKTIGADLFGEWPACPVRIDGTPDPLLILLAHSDCEGKLQHKYLLAIAARLEELLPLLGTEDGGGHIGGYREKTETFIAGLRDAANAGEDVEFH